MEVEGEKSRMSLGLLLESMTHCASKRGRRVSDEYNQFNNLNLLTMVIESSLKSS